MTDKALVERLREEADEWDEPKIHDEFDMRGLLHSAADRIEALIAEKEAARKEERAAVVAWLDKKAEDFALNPPHAYSDMIASIVSMSIMGCTETIEAGEHLK